MTHDEGRSVESGDDVGHRKGLAGSGHAEQNLRVSAGLDTVYQRLDGFRLVSRGLIWTLELEQVGITNDELRIKK